MERERKWCGNGTENLRNHLHHGKDRRQQTVANQQSAGVEQSVKQVNKQWLVTLTVRWEQV